MRLNGDLRMQEERLLIDDRRGFHLMLVVDGVPFEAGEIEGCVRLD